MAKPNGEYDASGAVICVSLASFYNDMANKLVATVIAPEYNR